MIFLYGELNPVFLTNELQCVNPGKKVYNKPQRIMVIYLGFQTNWVTDPKRERDWFADGYRCRQTGNFSYHNDKDCFCYYFKL